MLNCIKKRIENNFENTSVHYYEGTTYSYIVKAELSCTCKTGIQFLLCMDSTIYWTTKFSSMYLEVDLFIMILNE